MAILSQLFIEFGQIWRKNQYFLVKIWFLWLRILKNNVVYKMFSHDFLCTKVHYINPQVAVPVNTMDHNYCSINAKNHAILSRDWVTIWQIREAMLCFWNFSLKIFLKLKIKTSKKPAEVSSKVMSKTCISSRKTLDEATFSGYQTIAIFGHLCHEIMSHWGKNNVFCT